MKFKDLISKNCKVQGPNYGFFLKLTHFFIIFIELFTCLVKVLLAQKSHKINSCLNYVCYIGCQLGSCQYNTDLLQVICTLVVKSTLKTLGLQRIKHIIQLYKIFYKSIYICSIQFGNYSTPSAIQLRVTLQRNVYYQ